MINSEVIKYLRSIDGKPLKPGIECNSVAANLVTRLHPEIQSNLPTIIAELKSCNSLMEVRRIIKQYDINARKYLEDYGYQLTNSNRLMTGDFLVRPRKFFDDVVFMVDSNTKVGIAPNHSGDHKTAILRISKNIHISNKHLIYRR